MIRTSALLLLVLSTGLGGCSLGYYVQSARGQAELMSRREPISEVLADPDTPPALRERLEYVAAARTFASTELGLPDNGSYRLYADLERDYAVWNVVAAPEFSLEPRTWCFPIAGCVSYRGYFSRENAEEMARKLEADGYDVYSYGVTAYSTLGWFADPVLNTMLAYPDAQLAGTVFHELAHQQLYLKDDSAFNEAFARFVEIEGVRRWLDMRDDEEALADWRRTRNREKQFVELLMQIRRELTDLYASSLSVTDMRRRKRDVFDELRRRYARLCESWNGYGGYDAWFDQPLNNAHLVNVGTYEAGVPAFAGLLQEAGGDLSAFYEAARRVGDLPAPARRDWLLGDQP